MRKDKVDNRKPKISCAVAMLEKQKKCANPDRRNHVLQRYAAKSKECRWDKMVIE